MAEESKLSLTATDLQALIATAVSTAIQEARKPGPKSDREIADIEFAQRNREQTADQIIEAAESKRQLQRICSHTHSQREGGGTHCVWVREEDPRSPGYIICQLNQCKIRPGDYDPHGLPFQRDYNAIYDNTQFNKLFQDCGPVGLMG